MKYLTIIYLCNDSIYLNCAYFELFHNKTRTQIIKFSIEFILNV